MAPTPAPMRTTQTATLLLATAVLLAVAACKGESPSRFALCEAVREEATDQLLIVPTLQNNEYTFARGEPISATISVTNCSDEPIRRFYRDSQRYDITVEDFEGREVWRWSADRVFAQVLGETIFDTGETVTYEVVWDQRSDADQQVPPGGYQLLADDVGCDDESRRNCELGSGTVIEITP